MQTVEHNGRCPNGTIPKWYGYVHKDVTVSTWSLLVHAHRKAMCKLTLGIMRKAVRLLLVFFLTNFAVYFVFFFLALNDTSVHLVQSVGYCGLQALFSEGCECDSTPSHT